MWNKAIWATLAYVVVVVHGALAWWGPGKLRDMEPNAVGDFLAGTMAPVAIFWVMLTFWQQQKELRQNTEALRLQADELKAQVEATTRLVDLDSARLAREIGQDRAVFEVVPGSENLGFNGIVEVQLVNKGGRALNPECERRVFELPESPVIESGKTIKVRIMAGRPAALGFTDAMGARWRVQVVATQRGEVSVSAPVRLSETL
ncbi:MAG: hypothetical protein AAF430_12325 [Myxococcota bacterium]